MRDLLEEAGLPAAAHERPVRGYSEGMPRQAGVAVALAKDARELLLDEPMSGLIAEPGHEFSALLSRLSGRGVAILMATHDLFRALGVATQIGVLISGVLRWQRTPDLSAVGSEQQS